MTAASLLGFILLFSFPVRDVLSQISGMSLRREVQSRSELSSYYNWLTRTQLDKNFDGSVQYTLFAPNNTAFQQMNPDRRRRFEQMSVDQIRNYVSSYAVYAKSITATAMQDNTYYRSNGANQEKLFVAVKVTSGGNAGVSQYFINGARIVDADIRCSNGIIHIINNIPDPVSNKFIFSYLQQPDIPNLQITRFYRDLLLYLPESNYMTIPDFKNAEKVTLFVPSDRAIQQIPQNRLQELRQDAELLNQVISRHYIKDQVIHTSWVFHRQQFNTQLPGEKITFRKVKPDFFPERVYVMSEGVNAEITYGNITVANGVIHVVDSLLGYIFNSAMDQINQESNLNSFASLLGTAPADIQNILRNQQGRQLVTVFAPSNQAISDIQNLPGINFHTNRTLADMVIRYHVLEIGNTLVVKDVNKLYENRELRRTMYQGKNMVVYQRYNETFIECGYVRAKVVRPDVGVTNGYVQYIDRVFGVPSKDIPTTICEDSWLYKSYQVLLSTTLNTFLEDRRLSAGSPGRMCQMPVRPFTGQSSFNIQNTPRPINLNNQNNNQLNTNYRDDPNRPHEFTMFMTNGSALEYFEGTNLGRAISRETDRYRWVLRRHIIPGRVIHMDVLAEGEHTFQTDTRELIVIRKNGCGMRAHVEVVFGRKRAEVIHMDLGATNGVIHVLNDFLAVDEDRTRDLMVDEDHTRDSWSTKTVHGTSWSTKTVVDEGRVRDASGARTTITVCVITLLMLAILVNIL